MQYCNTEQCEAVQIAKGLCGRHYQRKYKDPQRCLYYDMKKRCNNPNAHNYKYYGGRGIKVCERWLDSYRNFLEDMGKRPKGLTIDRIDNDGDYTPDNCRWVSMAVQSLNKRQYHNNKSSVTGVYKRQDNGMWAASIRINNVSHHLGLFDKIEDAIKARLGAELNRSKALNN